MRDPIFGLGVQIKAATTTTAGATVFAAIPRMRGDIQTIGGSANQISVKAHDDTGRLDQMAAGLIKTNPVKFEMLFDPDEPAHAQILDDWADGTFRDYEIIYPDPVVLKRGFRGQVVDFQETVPMGDYIKCMGAFSIFTFDLNKA